MGPNLLSANRKSYTAYQMVSFSMTKSRLQKYAIIVVGTAQPLTRVPGVEVPLDCEFLAVHTSSRRAGPCGLRVPSRSHKFPTSFRRPWRSLALRVP